MQGTVTEKKPATWLIRAYAGRVDGKTAHVNRTVHGTKRDDGVQTVVASGDLSFFGQFTDDDSTWPLVLSARYGTFVDVTGAYPSLAQADARQQWMYS